MFRDIHIQCRGVVCVKRLLCLVCVLALCTSFGSCAVYPVIGSSAGYVLIDPGHGGFDGGTTAADGTLEKQINLAISLTLRDLLLVCGVPVRMTRQTDIAVGEKKVEDMRYRLEQYENADQVISIHQNHFSVAKYHGTQVFYSVNHSESEQLARMLQQSVVEHLQPDNNRQIKPATDGIFLLHHTTKPAVLVECGFLSNWEELDLLKKSDYQQELAFALLCGYWNDKKER